jgi:hypothetical protein
MESITLAVKAVNCAEVSLTKSLESVVLFLSSLLYAIVDVKAQKHTLQIRRILFIRIFFRGLTNALYSFHPREQQKSENIARHT